MSIITQGKEKVNSNTNGIRYHLRQIATGEAKETNFFGELTTPVNLLDSKTLKVMPSIFASALIPEGLDLYSVIAQSDNHAGSGDSTSDEAFTSSQANENLVGENGFDRVRYSYMSDERKKKYNGKRRKGRFWRALRTGMRYIAKQNVQGWAWYLLTLTSSEQSGDIDADFHVFSRWFFDPKRSGLPKMPYLKVPEKNKRGNLTHYHILIYAPVNIFGSTKHAVGWGARKIKNKWYEYHSAYIVDMEKIDDTEQDKKKAIGYVSKYVSKNIDDDLSFDKRKKRSFTYNRIFVIWRFSKAFSYVAKTVLKLHGEIEDVVSSFEAFVDYYVEMKMDKWTYDKIELFCIPF